LTFLLAFVVGGALCLLAQLVVDLTALTPAHTMVAFVSLGALVSGLGLYQPLVQVGGAGALVPLTAFGHTLTDGIMEALKADGALGLFTGGLTAAAFGVGVAVLSGFLMAVLFNPKG